MLVAQTTPELSVIVMVDKQRQRGAECLQALLAQSILNQMEIILIDFDDVPLPGSDHPNVCVIRQPRTITFGAAKAAGVRHSHAPIIAFVEEHVRVFPGWAEAVVAAHKERYAAISGEIHNGNPGEGISDVIAMMGYYRWLAPAKRIEGILLDSHNCTYKRDILLQLGDRLPFWLDCEIVLYTKLIQDGHKLLCDPRIKHAHINESDLRICKGYFLFNRL